MTRLSLVAVALLAALAPAARAHVVPTGVGSQTEVRITPRRIRVNYNLGFSSILGLGELRRMDADRSGSIDRAEQEAYLDALGAQLIPNLHVTLDGQPLALTILSRRGLGILGPIEQVAFDTWYELEGRCDLGPGPHRLELHEGNFEGQTAEQLLWVPLDQAADFARFETTQDHAPAPPLEQQGARRFLGRGLRIELELTPAALERDRAVVRIEPWLEAMARDLDVVRDGMVADLEAELDALAFQETRLGGGGGPAVGALAPMIAQMAPDRVLDADSGAAVPPPAATTTDGGLDAEGFTKAPDSRRMIQAFNEPFSILVLLTFFVWGALHAVLPGHGKTMVAAYLLGTRGRVADALRLGGIVTFTHTFALYTAGLALVWVVERHGGAQGQAFHERLVRHVSLLSGLGLVGYGVFLAFWRLQAVYARDGAHGHAHGHAHTHGPGEPQHDHGHAHTHADGTTHTHGHEHGPGHEHGHGAAAHDPAHAHDHGHAHTHADGTTHAHDHAGLSAEEHARVHAQEAAGVTSWRDLLILGVTGGIVPCPAGVTLVLYSLTFRSENTKKAFAYLTSFSLGLGSVLVAIALSMVLSRSFLLRGEAGKRLERSRAFLWLPVVTACLISLVGVAVCWEAFDPGYARLKGWAGLGG